MSRAGLWLRLSSGSSEGLPSVHGRSLCLSRVCGLRQSKWQQLLKEKWKKTDVRPESHFGFPEEGVCSSADESQGPSPRASSLGSQQVRGSIRSLSDTSGAHPVRPKIRAFVPRRKNRATQ